MVGLFTDCHWYVYSGQVYTDSMVSSLVSTIRYSKCYLTICSCMYVCVLYSFA